MIGLDGTWQRECTVDDVSDRGARLTVDDPIEGLPLQEFFLVIDRTCLSPLQARLGEWRPDRCSLPRADKSEGEQVELSDCRDSSAAIDFGQWTGCCG
jgi:hypothetical protein